MSAKQHGQVLRLQRKHAPDPDRRPDPALGERLWRAQSVRNAIVASLITVILFCVIWSMLSSLLERVLPWFTVLLGFLTGFAVRRAGLGLDWRFPTIAAIATLTGAVIGNVVVAAGFTAAELGTDTLTVLKNVTSLTWPSFYERVITAADAIYALAGALVAAFFANRALSRRQYSSLRRWQEQQE